MWDKEVIVAPLLEVFVISLVMLVTCFLQLPVEVTGVIFIEVIWGEVCAPTKPPLKQDTCYGTLLSQDSELYDKINMDD